MKRYGLILLMVFATNCYAQELGSNIAFCNFGESVLNTVRYGVIQIEVEFDHVFNEQSAIYFTSTYINISRNYNYTSFELGYIWYPFSNWFYLKMYPQLDLFIFEPVGEDPRVNFCYPSFGFKTGFQIDFKKLVLRAGIGYSYPGLLDWGVIDVGIGYKF